ncbi:uncharacterized protein LOC111059400 [Nilaparvata lugens]|uniref:uncharacterized protein LOC111059400 n=1 Tax=Nilaparvata lugens TaxID=108931 RepID=UPI00193CE8BB|nr:uncharacterized protein LOC111059400 [Nilaparvata lugens]
MPEDNNVQGEKHLSLECSEDVEPGNLTIIKELYPEIGDDIGYQDISDGGGSDGDHNDNNDDNIILDPDYCADKDGSAESTSSDDEDTSQLRITLQEGCDGVLVEAVAEETNQLEAVSGENNRITRKRPRRSELWKKNTRKRKLNNGEEYINSMGQESQGLLQEWNCKEHLTVH